VSLTKTKAQGRPRKTQLVDDLRAAVDEYKHIYVFTFENMRTSIFKEIRQHFRESKLFLGKNKVAQVALGRSDEDEFKDNLRHISAHLEGDAGLFFTDRSKSEVLKYFKGFKAPEFAKAGAVLTENIVLQPGPLSFASTMLDHLRKLGLVVEIDDGILYLREPFTAAAKGVPITPEQAKLLTHMDKKTVDFTMKLLAYWTDGTFEEL
jgi:mRNA turnover protein 4